MAQAFLHARDIAGEELLHELACLREEGREEGRAEGELHGRAALLQRQLTHRFGPLPAEATEHLSTATIAELDAVGERLLTAATLEEALGPPPSPP
jgi:hypothetical protein